MENPLLAEYLNGGVQVSIYQDGTKIRETLNDTPPVMPEQMDLKITNWCDAKCHWCHEGSTLKGRHGDIEAMLSILSPLPAGVEIAIGGGDPLSHPDFIPFVKALHRQGLIANVTVNGAHIDRHLGVLENLTSKNIIKGVGVSYAGNIPEWDYPNMVLHVISGIDSPRILDIPRHLKVLILGYKKHGRGLKLYDKKSLEIDVKIKSWYRELPIWARRHHLSFDNLAISQLNPRRLFASQESYDKRFMGEEGQFSLYLDGVTQTYGLSSYSADRQDWTHIQDMYQRVRNLNEKPVEDCVEVPPKL